MFVEEKCRRDTDDSGEVEFRSCMGILNMIVF